MNIDRPSLLWLLLLLPSQFALADDLCLATAKLNFTGPEKNVVCRSEIPELLNLKLDFKGAFGPFPIVDSEGKEQLLDTCKKYFQYIPHFGGACTSRADCWAEFSVYMRTCGTLLAIERAKKPIKSYLGKNPLSLKLLPPTVLPNGPTADNQDELEVAAANGESAESFLHSLESSDKKFDRKKYLEGWEVILHARADFDADGIEDALVSLSYVYDRYLGYSLGILKRASKYGPAKWTDFAEFDWRKPNSSFNRDAQQQASPAVGAR